MRSRRALSRRWTRVASYAGHVYLAEEARGPHQQHAYDEPQRHRELEVVADHVGAEDVLEHADHETADHRAAGAVDAAEQRRGERVPAGSIPGSAPRRALRVPAG